MPDISSEYAISQVVRTIVSTMAALTGSVEIFAGCEVMDLDTFNVGLGVYPRYISVRINQYVQHAYYYGQIFGLSVGDTVEVTHLREANRYVVTGAGSGSGTVSIEAILDAVVVDTEALEVVVDELTGTVVYAL